MNNKPVLTPQLVVVSGTAIIPFTAEPITQRKHSGFAAFKWYSVAHLQTSPVPSSGSKC